ncbi:membrane insertase OXA1 Ecym_5540 [Eremothecium cymbalariae DBVPG|uniref:Membrane insertase YidC/Oxa/ALB C-terminal domain-containing protein n=1 Tax=Eremothecium cymbalariae (strain CBS 270.75 / DBVPG 7215 / KCTC 17166 / NRRL Y-17582) TaxID=931890 RepID=I6NDY8_ERECY|nr:hypothetical protein Ecym_5540 [Eremothecium cymbalariae DBVPG\
MLKYSILRASTHARANIHSMWRPVGLSFGNIRHNSSITAESSTTTSDVVSSTSSVSEIQTQLPSFDSIELEQGIQAVGDASNQIGYLSSIGMANSWFWPTDIIQNILEHVHVYCGLPWWGTICVTTVMIRVLMFPLYVKYSDLFGRTSRVKPELDKVNKELMQYADVAEAQKITMKRRKLLNENGIKNRYLAVPILQLPIAISFFAGIRQMANYPVDGFSTQGIAWFKDLTQADPYLGLQTLTAALFISLARSGGESGAQQFSPQMKKLFTFLPLLTIPATMNLSSGVVVYLTMNGICSVVQTLLLKNSYIRGKLNIAEIVKHPQPASEGPPKGIIESFRENIKNAREQAERRAEMKEKQFKMQEAAKEEKSNSRIKIVRRSDLKKNQ